MKTLNSNALRISIVAMWVFILVFLAIGTFAQVTTVKSTEKAGKKHTALDKKKVPAPVTEIYLREYPGSNYENWYGYPGFVDDYGWYGYDPYVYAEEYPEYYVVEFEKEKVPHKVIYSKAGQKIATHRKLTTPLPKAVSEAISKGEYKGWKEVNDKEEIFKDTDADQLKVYKVEVEKGKEKHILFYQNDGKLLKDKKVIAKHPVS